MAEAKKHGLRKLVKILSCILAVIVAAALIYVAYVYFDYSRIEDNFSLEVAANGDNAKLETDKNYTAITQNIGFGAYTADFTFFMDGGKESWAKSEESVVQSVTTAADTVNKLTPDFILFQEVDFDSTRSYHIDESAILKSKFENYSSVFAVNYHSAFLMYPFTQPHGKSNSGLLTLGKVNATSAVRRSLPISESFSKFLDLDRCYSVTRYEVANGREFILYNVHLSAYGGNDEIRAAQMTMLFNDIKSEYEKGNYCVAGGDFNHDFTGDSTQKLNGEATTDYGWAQPFPIQLLPDCIVRCSDYSSPELIPTCRNCDIPYEKGNPTYIVDGFLVTENVKVASVENIETDFAYSDHNPVVLSFSLIDVQ